MSDHRPSVGWLRAWVPAGGARVLVLSSAALGMAVAAWVALDSDQASPASLAVGIVVFGLLFPGFVLGWCAWGITLYRRLVGGRVSDQTLAWSRAWRWKATVWTVGWSLLLGGIPSLVMGDG